MFTDPKALHDAIAQAIARLVSVHNAAENSIVSLPVSYPSGARAAVDITLSGDRCFVSDCAIGMREAEMAGAADFFDHAAKDAAAWFGVSYDGASVFAASAPLDRLEGAIVAVSNASSMAVGRAVLRAAESKERQANTEVFERVSSIFGRQNVTKSAEISGREVTWQAHNVVSYSGRKAIFEFVGHHGNAIASKYMMFSDICASDAQISLVSVVSSIRSMPKKTNMLSDVSSIIEIEANRDQFERYAALR